VSRIGLKINSAIARRPGLPTLCRVKSFTLAAFLALLLVSGCGKKAPEPVVPAAPPTPAEDPLAVRIGFFASMTGDQASFGTDALAGAQLAVEQVNAAGGLAGHPVKLIVEDTLSQRDGATSAARTLINDDKAVVLIGEIATDRSLAAAPIAQQAGIPMITPGSTNEQVTAVGDGIFRVCYTDAFQAGVMAAFARSINVTRAAILSDPSNSYSAGLAAAFSRDFTAGGGAVVAQSDYHSGEKDFTRQIEALKAQSPEIIFLPSYYREAALIIRQAREMGVDAPFLGTDAWDSQEFLNVGGEAVNNSYFSSHFSPENKAPGVEAFVNAFTQRFGKPPPPLAALGHDAVKLAANAIRRAGGSDPATLKAALAATSGFQGVTGTITFNSERNPTKPAIVLRVQDGKFTFLESSTPFVPSPNATPTATPAATPAATPMATASPVASPASP